MHSEKHVGQNQSTSWLMLRYAATGSDSPMCHCAMAHGPLLGHQMGPLQLLFNFRICKHSKMFKTDYQAVRNENKGDRMRMIWNF